MWIDLLNHCGVELVVQQNERKPKESKEHLNVNENYSSTHSFHLHEHCEIMHLNFVLNWMWDEQKMDRIHFIQLQGIHTEWITAYIYE